MDEHQNRYLFECSWETCNKVGGIYTVISSKIREALKVFGENYYLLGPDLKTNLDLRKPMKNAGTGSGKGRPSRTSPVVSGAGEFPGSPRSSWSISD